LPFVFGRINAKEVAPRSGDPKKLTGNGKSDQVIDVQPRHFRRDAERNFIDGGQVRDLSDRHQPERNLGQKVRDVMTLESVGLVLGSIYKPEVQNRKDINVEDRANTTEV